MSRIFQPGIYFHYCYILFFQLIVQWTIILKSMSLDEVGGNHLCFWNTINTTQFQRVSAWQVLDMFGRLLERPLIAADAHTRYRRLIKMFDKQLECCKMIFKQQMQTEETQGSVFTNNITRLFAINLTSAVYWSFRLLSCLQEHACGCRRFEICPAIAGTHTDPLQ